MQVRIRVTSPRSTRMGFWFRCTLPPRQKGIARTPNAIAAASIHLRSKKKGGYADILRPARRIHGGCKGGGVAKAGVEQEYLQ